MRKWRGRLTRRKKKAQDLSVRLRTTASGTRQRHTFNLLLCCTQDGWSLPIYDPFESSQGPQHVRSVASLQHPQNVVHHVLDRLLDAFELVVRQSDQRHVR